MITYERHPREYTVVGVLAAYEGFFTPRFIEFYGGTLQEIIAVVRDGQHYHFQQEGDKQRLAESFLRRVDSNAVDLEATYNQFEQEVVEYEALIATPREQYTKEMLLQLYEHYRSLMLCAQAGFDTLDYISVLSPEKQPIYTDWVTRVRHRAERIYKDGEHDFIPAYITWLQETHLPSYSVDELLFATPWEMEAYIREGNALPSPNELAKRKAFMFVRHYPVNKHELLIGEAATDRAERLNLFAGEDLDNLGLSEVAGRTAFPGTATGPVRIVNKRADMEGFKEGEILVSVMTDPSFVPIMQKAAGFITDEGGTLCHAAIVARELKKPCVIGTKLATRVLKNGDIVEVRANHGFVRVIT